MIVDLGMAVTLLIVGCGESVGDLVLGTKACHLHAGEVRPIVEDGVREPEVTRYSARGT